MISTDNFEKKSVVRMVPNRYDPLNVINLAYINGLYNKTVTD